MNGHEILSIEQRTLSGAVISPCEKYRYILWRALTLDALTAETARSITWIMLNPSTADARHNDPTITRVVNFSYSWGFHRVDVVNLYALRATNPRELYEVDDPIGEANNAHIAVACCVAERVMLAWGEHPMAKQREADVIRVAKESNKKLHCLGTTKRGAPLHPLYIPKDRTAMEYT